MGSGVSIPWKKKKVAPYTVDPPHKESHKDFTFAPNIFKRYEWETLKAFCQKYEIKQANLVIVFQRYMTHEEIYVRNFKVRTADVRNKFIPLSKLVQVINILIVHVLFLYPALPFSY